MLTVGQLLKITTRRSTPPWHAGELRTTLNLKGTLSLKSVISGFEAQKTVLFVQIRDASILESVSTLDELYGAWVWSHPGQNTVSQLRKILASSGAFVIAASKGGQTVGIAGMAKSLIALPTIRIVSPEVLTGYKDGLTGAGAVLVGVGMYLGGTPVWIAAGVAATGDVYVGIGVYEIVTAPSGQPLPAPTLVPVGQTGDSALVFGPDGVTVTDLGEVDNWTEFGTVDLGEVDNWPESAGFFSTTVNFGGWVGGNGNGNGG